MELVVGTSLINDPFSIAMFDYRKVCCAHVANPIQYDLLKLKLVQVVPRYRVCQPILHDWHVYIVHRNRYLQVHYYGM